MDDIDDQCMTSKKAKRGKSPRHFTEPGEDSAAETAFIDDLTKSHTEKNDTEPGNKGLVVQRSKSIISNTERNQKSRPLSIETRGERTIQIMPNTRGTYGLTFSTTNGMESIVATPIR